MSAQLTFTASIVVLESRRRSSRQLGRWLYVNRRRSRQPLSVENRGTDAASTTGHEGHRTAHGAGWASLFMKPCEAIRIVGGIAPVAGVASPPAGLYRPHDGGLCRPPVGHVGPVYLVERVVVNACMPWLMMVAGCSQCRPGVKTSTKSPARGLGVLLNFFGQEFDAGSMRHVRSAWRMVWDLKGLIEFKQ